MRFYVDVAVQFWHFERMNIIQWNRKIDASSSRKKTATKEEKKNEFIIWVAREMSIIDLLRRWLFLIIIVDRLMYAKEHL